MKTVCSRGKQMSAMDLKAWTLQQIMFHGSIRMHKQEKKYNYVGKDHNLR